MRVRNKISGTVVRPRLNVFRSNDHVYAQLIDDVTGKTIVSASSLDEQLRNTCSSIKGIAKAQVVGKALAERAIKEGIDAIVFDRAGYRYHGKVKALATAAREGGLTF